MAYVDFENNVTPINDTNLNAMQQGLMELVFPIGSTYITQTDVNPSTILRFGTWERLKGKVILGLDENDTDLSPIGKTGGEKQHTLTVSEMPSHNHTGSYYFEGSGGTAGIWAVRSLANLTGYKDVSSYTGGNQPHNIMQPYEVVGYMWIRRS